MELRQVDFASPAFEELLDLRDVVLRKPLEMIFTTDQISGEFDDFHFGVYDQCDLLATLLLKKINRNTLKMRQVAVRPELQSKGIGTFMIRAIEQWCEHHKYNILTLAARDTAIPFYKNQGYKTVSEPFHEVGIPHMTMEKKLN